MLDSMTLSQRNRYFMAGIALSSVCLLVALFHMTRLLPLYPELTGTAVKRIPGLLQRAAGYFFAVAPQAPFVTASVSIFYSLAASILIYFFFEKTQSPEILFFGLFTLSFVFEILRLVMPLRELYGFSGFFLTVGARLLFFGRFFGVLSLFASSVYAAGFQLQKQGTVVAITAVAALVVSLGIPIDGFSWDTNLVMLSGYTVVLRLAETSILVISVLSFFVAAYTRGSREYLGIGLGAFLVCAGRELLINADTWLTPVPGFIMLCAGTWLISAKLHQVYLWL
ncbi:MAG: hypothetical protein LBI67_00310 [Treponema sp.]|jgi:hypothetical protein|nr:hypothetical protein [Treponema sp.]